MAVGSRPATVLRCPMGFSVLWAAPGWQSKSLKSPSHVAWHGPSCPAFLAASLRRLATSLTPVPAQIVLATNIAETAITIEDVVCVINSGRLKEKSYDPYTGVSTLQAAWISKVRGAEGVCTSTAAGNASEQG